MIGGAGFLGKRIVDALVRRGEMQVAAFDIVKESPFDEADGVTYISGDITNADSVASAVRDVDVVIMTAAIIRFMDRLDHQYELSHRVNVIGTETVMKACVEAGVSSVLYCSTSHVTVPKRITSDIFVYSEESPYVTKDSSPNHYGVTKAEAERIAASYNGQKGTSVGIIRPCSGIFGPDDKLISQKDLDDGEAQLMIPETILDWVFVDNLVYAFFLLEKKLSIENSGVAGRAICVSNCEPRSIDEFHCMVKAAAKMEIEKEIRIVYLPRRFMYVIAHLVELILRFGVKSSQLGELDMLTPAMLDTASVSHVLRSDSAKKLLGYSPIFTVEEGCRLTCAEHKNRS